MPQLCAISLNKRIMATHTLAHEKSYTKVNQTTRVWEQEAEFNRFGLISILLTVVGCLGGITVGMGAIEHTWALIMILIPTMTTLSAILAVQPMRTIIYATSVSVIIDVTLLLYFLFV